MRALIQERNNTNERKVNAVMQKISQQSQDKVGAGTVCFGELLLRITHQQDWPSTPHAQLFVGGAEYNVSCALNMWQEPVHFITALPKNAIADLVEKHIKVQGLSCSLYRQSDSRLGFYITCGGADVKSNDVVYDRNDTAFSQLDSDVIDWKKTLSGKRWLHLSAISPALGINAYKNCLEAAKTAHELGLTISIDLNYRQSLWRKDIEPCSRIIPILKYCHWVMGNIWSAESLLNIQTVPELLNGDKRQYLEHARYTADKILSMSQSTQHVALTFRFDSEQRGIDYFAALINRKQSASSNTFSVKSVINRVGSGDCFMAGLIYGQNKGYSLQETLNYAVSAAVGHFQESTDYTTQSTLDIKKMVNLIE